jgi:hypothetical protein
MLQINETKLNKSKGCREEYIKGKEESPVSKCSHALILW